jgi:hypothetical protein
MFKSARWISDYLRENKKRLTLVLLLALGIVALCLLPAEREAVPEAPSEEERLLDVVSSVYGVGRCEVMLRCDGEGCVEGVIVLCEGAELPSVRARLNELISSLYGVGQNRISILKIAV